MNNPKDIDKYKIQIMESLREIDHAPSVAIGGEVPADPADDDDSEDENPDERDSQRKKDLRVAKDGDDDEDEKEEGSNKAQMAVDHSAEAAGAVANAGGVKDEAVAMDVDTAPAGGAVTEV